MTPAVLAPPERVGRHDVPEPDVRRGVTLDEVLSSAWEALASHDPAGCPFCGGAMRPRYASGATVVGGRCGECGTSVE